MAIKLNKNFKKKETSATKKKTTTKPKVAKTETKKVKPTIDKTANVKKLLETVKTIFNSNDYSVTISNRVSKFGGMVKLTAKDSSKILVEVWDELELNDRICIYTKDVLYNQYKDKVSKNINNYTAHENWANNVQFYVNRKDVDKVLKAVAKATIKK